jgi:hypothetical protein
MKLKKVRTGLKNRTYDDIFNGKCEKWTFFMKESLLSFFFILIVTNYNIGRAENSCDHSIFSNLITALMEGIVYY